jgi:hypothetical protein
MTVGMLNIVHFYMESLEEVVTMQLQALQRRLLEVIYAARPTALYPATLCCLAHLLQVCLPKGQP